MEVGTVLVPFFVYETYRTKHPCQSHLVNHVLTVQALLQSLAKFDASYCHLDKYNSEPMRWDALESVK